MGLLKVLTKEGRWTKHLPTGQRAKAEAILASESLQKYMKNRSSPQGVDAILAAMGFSDPQRVAREDRLAKLLNRAGMDEMDIYPRIGGGGYDPKSGLTGVEKTLGFGRKGMSGKFPPKRKLKTPVPNIPKTPSPKGWQRFVADLGSRAKALRAFAAKNKKPLMYAGAGGAALGLGLLGAHAATQGRHEELRGKG